MVTSPITIICYACSLMSYWVGLFGDDDKEDLVAGVKIMLKFAIRLVGKSSSSKKRKQLEDDGQSDAQYN